MTADQQLSQITSKVNEMDQALEATVTRLLSSGNDMTMATVRDDGELRQ
jgi:hypothetical protein